MGQRRGAGKGMRRETERRGMRAIAALLAAAIALTSIAWPARARADGTVLTLDVPVTFGQSEARSMLEMINGFRTGREAWYWNEDDASKTTYAAGELQPLEYDGGLEKVAMQRAVEIAIAYSHTRPNGESCFTAYEEQGIGGAKGENIAIGYPDAGSVFDGWREDLDRYEGQGHRRNMLGKGFRAIGIGHAVYDGVSAWVQEFSSGGSGTALAQANDADAVVPVQVLESKIVRTEVTVKPTDCEIPVGETAALPGARARIQLDDTWDFLMMAPVVTDFQWVSQNPKVASVEGDRIVAHEVGSTTLVCTASADAFRETRPALVMVEVLSKDGHSSGAGDAPGEGGPDDGSGDDFWESGPDDGSGDDFWAGTPDDGDDDDFWESGPDDGDDDDFWAGAPDDGDDDDFWDDGPDDGRPSEDDRPSSDGPDESDVPGSGGSNDGGSAPADSDGSIATVEVPLKYGQTEARKMEEMVNDFRAGSEAWFWNEDGASKTTYAAGELRPLEYDYDLEKVAMQRAAELAVAYSHTRPNGESCFTAYEEQRIAEGRWGENIAIGFSDAPSVFEAWQETDEEYDGQGHRRNMLSEGYGAIGIGHAVYGGVHVWAQEFAGTASGAAKTRANDAKDTVSVQVSRDKVLQAELSADEGKCEVVLGKAADLPEVTTSIRTDDTWDGIGEVKVADAYLWSVEDPKVASIEGDRITARKVGSTTLVCAPDSALSSLAGSLRIPLKVVKTAKARTQKITARSCTKTYGDPAFSLQAKARGKLTYKSSNAKVATVSKSGKVTLKGPGVAKITITAAAAGGYGKATKKVKVTVRPRRISSMEARVGGGKLTLRWKKDGKASGYQVVIAQNSKFTKGKKAVTVQGQKPSWKAQGGLRAGKTYYVKVRAYKKSGGKKVYGEYSHAMSIRMT